MIVINRAILHILDFDAGSTAFSDEELDVSGSIGDFLIKHVEKTVGSQASRTGRFYEDSECKKLLNSYLQGELDFIRLSKQMAHTLEQALSHAEEMVSADFILCDADVEGERKLVIFKCNGHRGYIHHTVQDGSRVRNEIADQYAIMPSLTQKMDESAVIDLNNFSINVQSKKYTIDGNSIYVLPEMLLECEQKASPTETIRKIDKAVKKVADDFGQDPVKASAAAKAYISEAVQELDEIDAAEAGKEIFADNPAMQNEYKEMIQEAGISEPVKIDKEATLKKLRNHKLKTDTGIELSIPIDYFDNTEFVEFNNNADGSLSITLKHIQNIVNKG